MVVAKYNGDIIGMILNPAMWKETEIEKCARRVRELIEVNGKSYLIYKKTVNDVYYSFDDNGQPRFDGWFPCGYNNFKKLQVIFKDNANVVFKEE